MINSVPTTENDYGTFRSWIKKVRSRTLSRRHCRLGVLAGLLCLVSGAVSGYPALPESDGQEHLGVATCASSVCHGSALERESTSVLQNEFVTWSRYDRHRNAYNTLLNQDSQRIARNLGLENAHEAKICLDCHADNVSAEMQGERFDITDGVGCESCHGGSEQWIASHILPATDQEEPIGLYPTASPEAVARLCLSCHLGTEDKFTTHRIMGAGHPRLSFELVTFMELMPPHWARDDDYQTRKGDSNLVNLWVVGQLMAAQEMLELMEHHWVSNPQLVPEVALFDCHACHHAMSEQRWKPFELIAGVEPGALRVNLAPFAFVLPIYEGLIGEPNAQMLDSIRALNRATSGSTATFQSALNALKVGLNQARDRAPSKITMEHSHGMLRAIARNAAEGDYRDYALAEQAAMAMNLMLESTGRWQATRPEMDALFEVLASEDHYLPEAFAAAAAQLSKVL